MWSRSILHHLSRRNRCHGYQLLPDLRQYCLRVREQCLPERFQFTRVRTTVIVSFCYIIIIEKYLDCHWLRASHVSDNRNMFPCRLFTFNPLTPTVVIWI